MSWFSNIFGGGHKSNPTHAAMPYLNQIPGQTSQYMQPYFEAGKEALNPLQGQYQQLLNNPGGKINEIGQSYHESPGFKFALQHALEAANHASAAGGMSGTPQDQFQQEQIATGLGNQDYNNWMTNALGQYNQGLHGEQGLAGLGQGAGQNLADMIAQTLAQQAQYGFRGQQETNARNNSLWGGIGKVGGAALGGLAGGPLGAFAGWNAT